MLAACAAYGLPSSHRLSPEPMSGEAFAALATNTPSRISGTARRRAGPEGSRHRPRRQRPDGERVPDGEPAAFPDEQRRGTGIEGEEREARAAQDGGDARARVLAAEACQREHAERRREADAECEPVRVAEPVEKRRSRP
jgi:hypothetical protein